MENVVVEVDVALQGILGMVQAHRLSKAHAGVDEHHDDRRVAERFEVRTLTRGQQPFERVVWNEGRRLRNDLRRCEFQEGAIADRLFQHEEFEELQQRPVVVRRSGLGGTDGDSFDVSLNMTGRHINRLLRDCQPIGRAGNAVTASDRQLIEPRIQARGAIVVDLQGPFGLAVAA